MSVYKSILFIPKQDRAGNFAKLMTLDQRAWCAPINLKITQDESNKNVMRLVKSSPIDKGTTVSLYQKTLSGKLMSRTINTAQDKKFTLKVNSNPENFSCSTDSHSNEKVYIGQMQNVYSKDFMLHDIMA